jgi:hypothetical protein
LQGQGSDVGKSSEYAYANYDGGWKKYPDKGLTGSLKVEDDGRWKMSFGHRKSIV